MPDGQAGSEPGVVLVDRPRFLVRSGVAAKAGAKPDCDFATALLRDLTVDPPRETAPYDVLFEALPDEEAAIIQRALAVELRSGRPKSAVRRWLADLLTRCTQAMTYAVAPIVSTLLNIDTLAIARRLRADPA